MLEKAKKGRAKPSQTQNKAVASIGKKRQRRQGEGEGEVEEPENAINPNNPNNAGHAGHAGINLGGEKQGEVDQVDRPLIRYTRPSAEVSMLPAAIRAELSSCSCILAHLYLPVLTLTLTSEASTRGSTGSTGGRKRVKNGEYLCYMSCLVLSCLAVLQSCSIILLCLQVQFLSITRTRTRTNIYPACLPACLLSSPEHCPALHPESTLNTALHFTLNPP